MKKAMEWSARVEELLQKNLSLGVELKNFKATSEERLRQVSLQLDQKLDASSNELKFNSDIQPLRASSKSKISQLWLGVHSQKKKMRWILFY